MIANILYSPYGQLGLVLLFVLTVAIAVRFLDKRARKKRRKKKRKLRS